VTSLPSRLRISASQLPCVAAIPAIAEASIRVEPLAYP